MIKRIKAIWFFTYRLVFVSLYLIGCGLFCYGTLTVMQLAGV